MRNSKHGLKALVMGIMVVLGAMALAAGAQAQGHHFELLHKELLHAGSLLTHTELLTKEANHNKSGGTLNPTPLTDGGTLGDILGQLSRNRRLKSASHGSTSRHRRPFSRRQKH